jgi:hypothetical protein
MAIATNTWNNWARGTEDEVLALKQRVADLEKELNHVRERLKGFICDHAADRGGVEDRLRLLEKLTGHLCAAYPGMPPVSAAKPDKEKREDPPCAETILRFLEAFDRLDRFEMEHRGLRGWGSFEQWEREAQPISTVITWLRTLAAP